MSDDPQLVATYRLQLHAGFTFADAAAIVPYLAELGVSHLYLSPILQAVPGSLHGYDQCDPTQVSEDLGGETGFRRLVAETRRFRMGIVLDIVPNHMAASGLNPWWWELLSSGQEGRSGPYFDIEWTPGDPDLDGRVMLPVLGRPLDDVVAAGELAIEARGTAPVMRYFDQAFPLQDVGTETTASTALLDRQHYSLVFWREAATRLNYRRFFDINSLVALREEDPAVFAAVHDVPLRMVEEQQVHGLRVDHVDGLRDPLGYLTALQRRAPGAWLLVEKILEPGEHLPRAWPVAGTTGYDFIHRLQGVFIDASAAGALTLTYGDFTGEPTDYQGVVDESKQEVAHTLFGSDVARLDRVFARTCVGRVEATSPEARVAVLQAVAAALPVYRTYARVGEPLDASDRGYIEEATRRARQLVPTLDQAHLRVLSSALLGELEGEDAGELALRFQQLSGPLMAKGVEDTAFYRYLRLVCLNEVGGNPGEFGVSVEDFHSANREALDRHPTGMLASSTHDTKRSEDVRARLSLLSQVPEEWSAAVRRWSSINQRHWQGARPDRNTEYLLYQVLVGAWPLEEDRAVAYMEKATREAKRHTSWTDPNAEYDSGLRGFVSGVCRDAAFQADLRGFVNPLVSAGRTVSLAMTLLRLTAPGVPDLYQGSELWDLSLVDPDNRRPVDYATRGELLRRRHDLPPGPGEDHVGLSKLHLIRESLALRRLVPDAFSETSAYTPLWAEGPAADNLIAFGRGPGADPRMIVAVVPRLSLRRPPAWSETTLELGDGEWTSVLDGGAVDGHRVTVAALFERFPVALLRRER